jgi:hypothetical protein
LTSIFHGDSGSVAGRWAKSKAMVDALRLDVDGDDPLQLKHSHNHFLGARGAEHAQSVF